MPAALSLAWPLKAHHPHFRSFRGCGVWCAAPHSAGGVPLPGSAQLFLAIPPCGVLRAARHAAVGFTFRRSAAAPADHAAPGVARGGLEAGRRPGPAGTEHSDPQGGRARRASPSGNTKLALPGIGPASSNTAQASADHAAAAIAHTAPSRYMADHGARRQRRCAASTPSASHRPPALVGTSRGYGGSTTCPSGSTSKLPSWCLKTISAIGLARR